MPELRLDRTPTPSQEQEQDQRHRLITSRKHQQAIELLQYPVQKLSRWVNQKLQENPLLELDNRSDGLHQLETAEETESPLDEVNLDELVNRGEDYTVNNGSRSSDQEDPEFQFRAMASQHQTLQDSLRWQLSLRNLPSEEEALAERLLSHLDEDGYFQGHLDRISRDLNVPRGRLESLLSLIQEFEPAGIGGRNLREVLLIQLRQEFDNQIKETEEIIEKHLEDLQNRRFNKIAKATGVDEKTVQDVADRIRDLEPRPGRVHEPVNRQYITADVRVRRVNGNFSIIINEEIPPLSINSRYKALLDSGDEETREYVEDKLKGALWIIRCIHQRHETLHKVTKSVARHQSDFFNRGARALRPLVLKDIADRVDVHESTVSRAVRNKYVQTSRGLFPLDFFFSSELETEGDKEGIASTAVKAQIKEMIENEIPTDPLSDRQIKEKLNERGIKIGRRTISKYRKDY